MFTRIFNHFLVFLGLLLPVSAIAAPLTSEAQDEVVSILMQVFDVPMTPVSTDSVTPSVIVFQDMQDWVEHALAKLAYPEIFSHPPLVTKEHLALQLPQEKPINQSPPVLTQNYMPLQNWVALGLTQAFNHFPQNLPQVDSNEVAKAHLQAVVAIEIKPGREAHLPAPNLSRFIAKKALELQHAHDIPGSAGSSPAFDFALLSDWVNSKLALAFRDLPTAAPISLRDEDSTPQVLVATAHDNDNHAQTNEVIQTLTALHHDLISFIEKPYASPPTQIVLAHEVTSDQGKKLDHASPSHAIMPIAIAAADWSTLMEKLHGFITISQKFTSDLSKNNVVKIAENKILSFKNVISNSPVFNRDEIAGKAPVNRVIVQREAPPNRAVIALENQMQVTLDKLRNQNADLVDRVNHLNHEMLLLESAIAQMQAASQKRAAKPISQPAFATAHVSPVKKPMIVVSAPQKITVKPAYLFSSRFSYENLSSWVSFKDPLERGFFPDVRTQQHLAIKPHAITPSVSTHPALKAKASQQKLLAQAPRPLAIPVPPEKISIKKYFEHEQWLGVTPQFTVENTAVPINHDAIVITFPGTANQLKKELVSELKSMLGAMETMSEQQSVSIKSTILQPGFIFYAILALAMGLILSAIGLLSWLLWPKLRTLFQFESKVKKSITRSEQVLQYQQAMKARLVPQVQKPKPIVEPDVTTVPRPVRGISASTSPTRGEVIIPIHAEIKPATIDIQTQPELAFIAKDEPTHTDVPDALTKAGHLPPVQVEQEEEGEYDFMSSQDAVPIKLDLARAYLEMEDFESVEQVLQTVFQKGNKDQQEEARLLLEQAKLAKAEV